MYVVTTVFENAIEIWDGQKDDDTKPTGQMLLYIGNHPYHVGDEVKLAVIRTEEKLTPEMSEIMYYTLEPKGRSGITK